MLLFLLYLEVENNFSLMHSTAPNPKCLRHSKAVYSTILTYSSTESLETRKQAFEMPLWTSDASWTQLYHWYPSTSEIICTSALASRGTLSTLYASRKNGALAYNQYRLGLGWNSPWKLLSSWSAFLINFCISAFSIPSLALLITSV